MDRDIAAWQAEIDRLRAELAILHRDNARLHEDLDAELDRPPLVDHWVTVVNQHAEIARLRVELARANQRTYDWANLCHRAEKAEARLADVIALCDTADAKPSSIGLMSIDVVRATATGDPK